MAWKDWVVVEADIGHLQTAVVNVPAVEIFMTSPAPGQIARFLHNQYYQGRCRLERLVRYASVVGREHVMAGVDCGFGTFAGRAQVNSNIVWLKLQALTAGARLASQELW